MKARDQDPATLRALAAEMRKKAKSYAKWARNPNDERFRWDMQAQTFTRWAARLEKRARANERARAPAMALSTGGDPSENDDCAKCAHNESSHDGGDCQMCGCAAFVRKAEHRGSRV